MLFNRHFTLQGKLHWESKIPVSFMAFHNFQFGSICHQKWCNKEDLFYRYSCFQHELLHPCPCLKHLKTWAMKTIYPSFGANQNCTLMLLTNVAQPEWISVSCNEKLLSHVFCVQESARGPNIDLSVGVANIFHLKTCSHSVILLENKCHIFLWKSTSTGRHIISQQEQISISSITLATLVDMDKLKDCFLSVHAEIPLFLTCIEPSKAVVLKCKKHIALVLCHTSDFLSHLEGFMVFKEIEKIITIGENMFECSDGGYVLSMFRCDGAINCANDASDEHGCNFISTESPFALHEYTGTNQWNKSCGLMFYRTLDGHCKVYGWLKMTLMPSHKYHSKNCTNLLLQNDLIPNNEHAEDENHLVQLLTYDIPFNCSHPAELPCKQGHSKCFNISDMCTYSLNEVGHLTPCRNAGHMEDCTKFECYQTFKCEKSYCIPWIYVCNGKWDCPRGEDESFKNVCGQGPTCVKMFKCRNSSTSCLHLGNVCDGSSDCPFQDDEQLCELTTTQCFTNCSCLVCALHCFMTKVEYTYFPFQFVFLHHVPISFVSFMKANWLVQFLYLHENNVKEVCHIKFSDHIAFFEISFNNVQSLSKNCFLSHSKMKYISLANNCITFVEPSAFAKLSVLVFLSLSGNPLVSYKIQLR